MELLFHFPLRDSLAGWEGGQGLWPGDLALPASILTYYHERDLSSFVSIYKMVMFACEQKAVSTVLQGQC